MDHADFVKMVEDYVCGLSEDEIEEAEKVLRDMQNARYTEDIRDTSLPGEYENSYKPFGKAFRELAEDMDEADLEDLLNTLRLLIGKISEKCHGKLEMLKKTFEAG